MEEIKLFYTQDEVDEISTDVYIKAYRDGEEAAWRKIGEAKNISFQMDWSRYGWTVNQEKP